MNECVYCHKKFDTIGQLKGHYGNCGKKNEAFEKVITKEFLKEMFEERDYCANYIAKCILKDVLPTRVHTGYIINKAKSFGIKTKTIKESANNKDRRLRQINTNITKYGYTNVSQNNDIQKKKEETFMKHYGLRNIFCNNDYIKEKFKEKYGVSCPAYLNKPFNQKNNFNTSIHKKVLTILEKYDISYISDKHINLLKYNEDLGRNYNPRPDIIIEDHKIIIEVQGNYWHANPRIYKPSDVFRLYTGYKTAEEIWKHDEIRKKHIESFGYKVYYLWEDDINNCLENVECQIVKWLGLNQ